MLKKALFFLILLLIFSNCKDEVCGCEVDKSTQKKNDSIITLVKENRIKHNFWGSMNEPYLDTFKNEAYRVYVLNSFGEYRKIVRIENTGKQYQLTVKKYHDALMFGGDYDTIPCINYTKPLSENQWTEITKVINGNCFWTMKSIMGNPRTCLDEGVLFIEGNNPQMKCSHLKQYHIVGGSCGVDSLEGYKYFQLCDLLLDLDK